MKSGDVELSPEDQAILRHVALYRLTLAEVVSQLFFGGNAGRAGRLLGGLAKNGFLNRHNKIANGALPGPVTNYTLTPEGARAAGAEKERGEPLGPLALPTHLAVLWFCCLSDRRRYRLEPEELKSLLGDKSVHPNTACCIAEEEDGPCLYRIFPTTANPVNAMSQLRDTVSEAWDKKPTLRSWMESGDLGFVVLAESKPKCSDLEKLVRKYTGDTERIDHDCRILVRFAPSPKGVKKALAAFKGPRA